MRIIQKIKKLYILIMNPLQTSQSHDKSILRTIGLFTNHNRTERVVSLGNHKINGITTKFNNSVAVGLDEPSHAIFANNDCCNCETFMKLIKKMTKILSDKNLDAYPDIR